VLDVRRAAANLLFVVVVVAWHAMPPWLLMLKTGLGRAVPRGFRLKGKPTYRLTRHGPLVEVWLMLARMAGLSCGKEVRILMLNSGK